MKICSCICGSKAELKSFSNELHLVKCEKVGCWIGKTCRTKMETAKEWNRIMVVVIGLEASFGTVFDEVSCKACDKAGSFQFCDRHFPF